MTEKRFDILVEDKVARTIKDELTAIGNSARGTRGFIAQLKAEMAGLASAAGGMGSTASSTSRALRDEAAASNAATTALRAQRLEAEKLTRALEAQAKAARAAAAANATAGAGAANATAGAGAGGAGNTPPPPPPAPRPAPTPGGGTGGAGRAASSAAMAARSIREVGEASKLSSQYAAQLGFQLNDIGVSLASGQKPLTVFIQQGAQIAQIPAQAGLSWKQFGTQLAGTLNITKRTGDAALDAAAAQATMAARAVAAAEASVASNVLVAETEVALATAQAQAAATAGEQAAASVRLTAANDALAASNAEAAVTARALATAQGNAATANEAAAASSVRGLSGFARAGLVGIAVGTAFAVTLGALKSEANDDSGLKKYAKSMGYTASEVKKLNDVSVSWGDTAKAVFQVGAERVATAFGISTAAIARAWGKAMDLLATTTRNTVAGAYALLVGLGYAASRVYDNIKNQRAEKPFDTLKNGFKDAYGDAQGFMDDVVKQAQRNAKKRQDDMAALMVADPKKNKAKGWDRAQNLKNDNAELDAQIQLTSKYGDELERANMLEQISKKYRDHNVALTAAETEALEKKILALQNGRRVQEAMTAAEEAANGPARKYADTVTALDNLLDKDIIKLDEYQRQINMAKRAFEDATDPLAQFNRELEKSGQIMGLYGKDRAYQEFLQQMEDTAQQQGRSIYDTSAQVGPDGAVIVGGKRRLTKEAQTTADTYREQQQQGDYQQYFESRDPNQQAQDPNNDSYVLDHYKELYAEIERLRQANVISEEEAAMRLQILDQDYLNARLQNAGRVFGQLTALQQSKNRELAALGKAAAIAQATIDGIAAVQAALKGPPGPPWSFAIAAATGVATAANVAKIAGIGFQKGGYTGNMAADQVAGAVHGREYVFDAAATARIGVPALDSMRRGDSLSRPSNDNGGGRRGGVSIVQGPGTYVEAVEKSDGEIEIIAERVARRVAPGAVADDIHKGANTKTSRALQASYGVSRNR